MTTVRNGIRAGVGVCVQQKYHQPRELQPGFTVSRRTRHATTEYRG